MESRGVASRRDVSSRIVVYLEGQMTTLLAWVAADQRGPPSIRIAADSRISWSSANGTVLRHWDFGRKIFASHQHPDVLGYCGDVLFPTQTLGQIIELVDREAFFPAGAGPRDRVQLIVAALERAASGYPAEEARDFTIVHCTRVGEYMDAVFEVCAVAFSAGKAGSFSRVMVPRESGVIAVWGSGATQYKSHLARWQASDVRGTSRAMFSSFCEFLSGATSMTTLCLRGIYAHRKHRSRISF